MRAAVAAGLWAAGRTDGLVDPTLLEALEALGYRSSLRDAAPAALTDALASAPPRGPAAPHPAERWRGWSVEDAAGVIRRPPGARFNTGGTGKGLAADAVAHRAGPASTPWCAQRPAQRDDGVRPAPRTVRSRSSACSPLLLSRRKEQRASVGATA